MSKSRVVSALILITVTSVPCWTAAQGPTQVPEFFGAYVRSSGSLMELEPNPSQAATFGTGLGGADLIKALTGPQLQDGDLEIVVFLPSGPGATRLQLARLAWVPKQASRSGFGGGPLQVNEPLTDIGMWHLTDTGIEARVAPITGQDPRMVRAVPTSPLGRGAYGVILNRTLYTFAVGPEARQSSPCEVRVISVGGAGYQPCPGWMDRSTQSVLGQSAAPNSLTHSPSASNSSSGTGILGQLYVRNRTFGPVQVFLDGADAPTELGVGNSTWPQALEIGSTHRLRVIIGGRLFQRRQVFEREFRMRGPYTTVEISAGGMELR